MEKASSFLYGQQGNIGFAIVRWNKQIMDYLTRGKTHRERKTKKKKKKRRTEQNYLDSRGKRFLGFEIPYLLNLKWG